MSSQRLAISLRAPFRRVLSTSSANLSGHNKWSKIKDKKGSADLQKGAVYSKASRDILIAPGEALIPNKMLDLRL